MAQILNGNSIAAQIRAEVAKQVSNVSAEHGITPGLNLLLVGDDPASDVYVRNKARDCSEVGINSTVVRTSADTSETEVITLIQQWNAEATVHGILVQLPLPRHINEQRVLQAIHPDKDVDGFHPMNVGRMTVGLDAFIPCTPAGVLEMLRRSDIRPEGKHVVVVGRSNIVGKPLAILLSQKHPMGNATVTLCHSGTTDLAAHTRRADIVIVAVGKANTITADHVKDGSVVVDVGMNRIAQPGGKSKLVGDVAYEEVAAKAAAITPVPGGVGPMTRAMLLVNTMKAYATFRRIPEQQ